MRNKLSLQTVPNKKTRPEFLLKLIGLGATRAGSNPAFGTKNLKKNQQLNPQTFCPQSVPRHFWGHSFSACLTGAPLPALRHLKKDPGLGTVGVGPISDRRGGNRPTSRGRSAATNPNSWPGVFGEVIPLGQSTQSRDQLEQRILVAAPGR